MKRNGLDEEGAMKKIINHVAELYKDGEISIREAAEILQLNFRQTLEILEKKVGGNVERDQETKALNLAKRLAESQAHS
jgi:predicted HTH domain antitoxin